LQSSSTVGNGEHSSDSNSGHSTDNDGDSKMLITLPIESDPLALQGTGGDDSSGAGASNN